jgi:TRAP transporter 4TM/12TM fusion protein
MTVRSETVGEASTAEMPDEPWAVRVLTPILGALLTVIALILAAELHLMVGLTLLTEQGLAAILGLAFAIVFIRFPAMRAGPRTRIPWYDIVLAVLGVTAAGYLVVRYPTLAENFFFLRTEAFAVSVIVIPLCIEALRRTTGWSLVAILVAFLLYGLFGHLVPGKLEGQSQSLYKLVAYLGVDNVALFGLPMTIVCTVVVMFIFLGQLLLKSGGSFWFTDLAMAMMGRTRGGSAKIAVLASGLFGSISGSAVSNVLSTGVITIPLMRDAGFDRKTAAAFEAVASTGGQIMPPIMGAAAFLMAEFLEVAYTEVVLAALVPAVLYYTAVLIQADLEAARRGIAPVPREMIPALVGVLREGWFFAVPFVVLVLALFKWNRRPEEAALWAAATIIVLSMIFGYRGKRLNLAAVIDTVKSTGVISIDIVIIGTMAGMIIGVVEVTGLGFGLTFVLVEFGEGNLIGLLLITAVICVILGMGMPTTAIYFLVATLAAPPLIKLGVYPMSAHLFVLYFGLLSMISPPVAMAAFAASKLAGSKPMETAVSAVRLGWTAFIIPFMFVLSPTLIMRGSVGQVVLSVVTAGLGVWVASAGFVGYFTRPLPFIPRIGFVAAGLALLVPAQAFHGAMIVEVCGAVVGAICVGHELITARSRKAK